VVVVATPRRALGVAARPGGHIDREDQRIGVGQAAGEQIPEPLDVDATTGKRGIRAAPTTPVDRLQAEVRQRRERLGAQQRVAELEQGISAAGAAGVQLGPEGAEPRQGGSWHRHGRAA